jgi:hypothetical protein
MGHQYPFCPDPAAFPIPGPAAETAGGGFDALPSAGPGDFSLSYGDNAAGNLQFFTELLHCQGVPPAFPSRP